MSHLRKMFRKQLDFTEFRPKRGTSIRNSATTYITTAQWLIVNFMRQFTANFFFLKVEFKFLKQFCSHPLLFISSVILQQDTLQWLVVNFMRQFTANFFG